MDNDKPAIRNAYQKLRAGDIVTFKSYPTGKRATVIAKERLGFIATTAGRIMGADIVAIERDGQGVF